MRRIESLTSVKRVILSFVCITSRRLPNTAFIMPGIPGGRHLALLSYSAEPAMRELRISSHLAMYFGVSFGAVGERPLRPSETGAIVVGRGGGPRLAGALPDLSSASLIVA